MTIEEYQSELKLLESEFLKRKYRLVKECALSNNDYQIGDIFTDHIGSIKVEQIDVVLSSQKPTCVYCGIELKKDGTPTKKRTKRQAWQINDISKSKSPGEELKINLNQPVK